jgi:hypothetical protein
MLGSLPLLTLQACVIIAAARGVGAVARRLGQPAMIAEVMVGILLGPSLLGRVPPSLFETLFPKSSLPGLSLVSQVGHRHEHHRFPRAGSDPGRAEADPHEDGLGGPGLRRG